MKQLGVMVALIASLGVATLLAENIIVNAHPEDHLKKLFPKAAAFSAKTGAPPHFVAYAQDPKAVPSAAPLGYAFWTPELLPEEHGYHGAIHILVGMDLTGVLTGVVVDYDSEPYGYFSVEPPQFAAQFRGKSIRDPFRVGGDVDYVSRATLSVTSAARAIRDSARMMARQYLSPEAVKR